MKNRFIAFSIIIMSVVFFFTRNSSALTAEEMIKLKKIGVPDNLIILMIENDYRDVDSVLKLKEAGFKDETIEVFIKNEVKDKPSNSPVKEATTKDNSIEKVNFETTANMKILWYMIYKGKPILQNSDAMEDARVSLINNNTVKFEWKEKGGLGLLDALMKKPFKSPFYWNLDNDDTISSGKEGYTYMLKSTTTHKGNPDTDGSHYWTIYFDPKDVKIVDHIKNALKK